MATESIEQIQQWVYEYFEGYVKYMSKYHQELLNKFWQNIQPPQRIGGGVPIGKSARNTVADYDEIQRVSVEFYEKYPNPIDFPKDF